MKIVRSDYQQLRGNGRSRNGIPRLTGLAIMLIAALSPIVNGQDTINWSSGVNKPNQTSIGQPMDGTFRFQLGVFAGSFVPTPSNTSEWAVNWVSARHKSYVVSTSRYADSFAVTTNNAPFTFGKATYVWGFSGDASSGEWILFRASNWTWPSTTSSPPGFLTWQAKDATAILGQIEPSGTPFLMKTALVTNVTPPSVSWNQWVSTDLNAVPLAGPDDDPDGDGSCNLLEFIFGTNPTTATPPVASTTSVDSGYLVITIPRRADRSANLVVEVSSDLENWQSGSEFTELSSSGPGFIEVRDLVAIGDAVRTRFMRLKALLP